VVFEKIRKSSSPSFRTYWVHAALRPLILLPSLLILIIGVFAQNRMTQVAASEPDSPQVGGTCPITATSTWAPSATPTVSVILFSPPVVTVNNPTLSSNKTRRSSIKLSVTAYDNSGNVLTPTGDNPLYVEIDGAPSKSIVPRIRKITSGNVARFEYSGKYFPNPINVEAWIKIPNGTAELGEYALGTTQILGQNQNTCAYGSKSFPLEVNCSGETTEQCETDNITSAHGVQVMAAVGYKDASDASFTPYTVDTGSLGVVVPVGDLPTGSEAGWIGPGAPGEKAYTSNGQHSFTGNYYLAPVGLQLSNGGVVQTSRIMVLVLSAGQNLHYLGIGFNRENFTYEDLFQSPADNAFLHLTDSSNGTDISPGYQIGAASVTLGLTSVSGYNLIALATTGAQVPGEYADAAGCFNFPGAPDNAGPLCGSMLFDIGIGDMYLGVDDFERPSGYNTGGVVTTGDTVNIIGGSPVSPAMCYSFQSGGNSLITPYAANWTQPPEPCGVFFNTGRTGLSAYNYTYDARCGNVGFQPLADPLSATNCQAP
jgi:hypothetical protein